MVTATTINVRGFTVHHNLLAGSLLGNDLLV